MDVEHAIHRPFSDAKKLGIGVLLSVIPLVNIITSIFVSGYLFYCAQTAMKKKKPLPEWKDWGDLAVKGILVFLIWIIYMLPLVVVAIILLGSTLLKIGSMMVSPAQEAMPMVAQVLGTIGFALVFLILLLLLTFYIIPAAILRFVAYGNWKSAFAIPEVFKEAFTGTYASAWFMAAFITLVLGVINGLLNFALMITMVLPFVVTAFISTVSGIITMTLFGQAYAEIKKR
ncbi:DUF4013 domain-containing protein [Candidatus Woesearchaeota archaeon]|nr:DUF4013 domain-containing protein [Candidatus Woesearchaeota archaeon]